MTGLYQVSSDPVSKYDLLNMVARIYGKKIEIKPSEEVIIDRSLMSDRFRSMTQYSPPDWERLIQIMHEDYLQKRDIYLKI
jgi:dTDP-4-dehydrorhamnose reductase